jgi:hypothetical protein
MYEYLSTEEIELLSWRILTIKKLNYGNKDIF